MGIFFLAADCFNFEEEMAVSCYLLDQVSGGRVPVRTHDYLCERASRLTRLLGK